MKKQKAIELKQHELQRCKALQTVYAVIAGVSAAVSVLSIVFNAIPVGILAIFVAVICVILGIHYTDRKVILRNQIDALKTIPSYDWKEYER